MKRTRRVIALLMALVLAATMTCITAFAAQKKQYHAYTFFGDSITAGVGLDSYNAFFARDESAEGRRVPGTYADLVATEVGLTNGEENFYNEAHSGWRTSEVREILDETYVNDDGAFAKAIANSMQIHKGTMQEETIEKTRARIQDEIRQSDIITLAIGSNDVQLSLFMALFKGLYPSEENGYTPWQLEKFLNQYATTSDAIKSLSETIASIHGIEYLLELVTKNTLEALNKFRVNYPVIIQKIKALNPNADIYVIGLYNPMSSAVISDSIPLQVGKIIDPLILSMNLYLYALNPARSQYTYVDAFNTEVIDTVNFGEILTTGGTIDWSGLGKYTIAVHPNANGHRYIADQLLKAIPDATEEPAEPLNGLAKGPDGYWAMYDNGAVDTSFTGLVKQPANGVWYYVEDGYVNWDYTGFVKNEKGWWRVKDGRVDFNANSIYKQPSNGVWYKCTNGFISWDESSIYKNENGWWKCTDSRVTFKETGIFKNVNGTWYVVNSKVNFDKTGKVKVNGKTYKVESGRVVA